MSSFDSGLFLLESIIDSLRKSLEQYATLPNARTAYIERQNKLITELCNSFNMLNTLSYHEVWERIEQSIKNIEAKDGEIHGHNIIIRFKPEGNNFSLINYDPFNK